MLVALELHPRQAARVLAQAVRTRVKLEIEPRPEAHNRLLWGTLVERQQDTLLVELHEDGQQRPLAALVGAMCDVRTILSGQLCLFSTFILEARGDAVPARIALAVPDAIQVANRRRFARKAPADPIHVRVLPPGSPVPLIVALANISARGLGCHALSRELDEHLYIGDEVMLEFALPWCGEAFRLPASVCTKAPAGEPGHLLIGFELLPRASAAIERLRAALTDETVRLTETDGEL
ncbi:MAG: PilZ domain-containing protein [Planctomycetota bacterium]